MGRSALIAVALSLILSPHAGFALQYEHGAMATPAAAYAARGHSVTFHSSPGDGMGYLSLNFGGEDRGIVPSDVKAFEAALIKAHKPADVKIYGGAGYAFMNPDDKTGYVAAAAQRCAAADRRFLCAVP